MQPNILLITSDHHRSDLLGCAGHPVVRTPHLDYLSRAGIRFSRAYSGTPVCMPARYSIMTGMEGPSLGMTELKNEPIPTSETLPSLLCQSGYQTRGVGKMHFWPQRAHYGFENVLLCEEGRFITSPAGRRLDDYETWLAEQGHAGDAFGHGVANNESFMAPWHLDDHLHPTEWIGRESCREIKRRDWTRPLFMWVSFTAPHPPLIPLMRDLYLYDRSEIPSPVIGDWVDRRPVRDEREAVIFDSAALRHDELSDTLRAYYALITQIDRQINRIIGTLREEGMLENTWILYTSDHGDLMGDHGLWAKRSFLEGSAHVPLIVCPPTNEWVYTQASLVPGQTQGDVPLPGYTTGNVVNALVGLEDILPTCMAAAGLDVPCVDGRNLLPLMTCEATQVREHFFGEVGEAGKRAFMVTDGRWKYLWFEEDGAELLFDLKVDPREEHDLLIQRPDVSTSLRQLLIDRLGARNDERAVRDGSLNPAGLDADGGDRNRWYWSFLPRGLHE